MNFQVNSKHEIADIKRRIVESAEHAKIHLGLTEEDIEKLRLEAAKVKPHLHGVAERATDQLLRDPEALAVVEKAGLTRERAVALFEEWLRQLFEGDYGEEYVLRLFKAGLIHVKVGVNERLMISQMGVFAKELLPLVDEKDALVKALSWNLAVMVYSYNYIKHVVFRDTIGVKKSLMERLFDMTTEELIGKLSDHARVKA